MRRESTGSFSRGHSTRKTRASTSPDRTLAQDGGSALSPTPPTALPEPLLIRSVAFGSFPSVDTFNPRFVPGRERLRVVIDVDAASIRPDVTAPALFGRLLRLLPSLGRHECGDTGGLAGSLAPGDTTLAAAHLLEHLVIDLQHRIAGMERCSGVTCGHESPRNRYDIFVETTDRLVGSLCVSLARDLMSALLAGSEPTTAQRCAIDLAREIYLRPRACVVPSWPAPGHGTPVEHGAALAILRDHGYLRALDHNINFSDVPVYRLASVGSARDS